MLCNRTDVLPLATITAKVLVGGRRQTETLEYTGYLIHRFSGAHDKVNDRLLCAPFSLRVRTRNQPDTRKCFRNENTNFEFCTRVFSFTDSEVLVPLSESRKSMKQALTTLYELVTRAPLVYSC